MAKVVRFDRYGGPEVLRVEDVEVPPPRKDEVQIRVRAAGLNRAEALLRAGTYIEEARFPSGLGLEAAGVVVCVGTDVRGLEPGDAVSIIPPVSMVSWPAHGELINVPSDRVVRNPPTLGAVEAAATWMQYLTAYGALVELASLGRGESIAITAASSSVGLAAIQIANRIGARPVAVTRSSAKKRALLDAGAAEVEADLAASLKQIGGPDGIRVVFDPVGGPALESLVEAMAPRGILIQYGALSPEPTPFPLRAVLGKTLTLRGYLVHEVTADPDRLERAKTYILEGIAEGGLRPIVSRTFPLEEIVEAHRYLERGEQFGKLVVTFPEGDPAE